MEPTVRTLLMGEMITAFLANAQRNTQGCVLARNPRATPTRLRIRRIAGGCVLARNPCATPPAAAGADKPRLRWSHARGGRAAPESAADRSRLPLYHREAGRSSEVR